jgi:hypothetical protein
MSARMPVVAATLVPSPPESDPQAVASRAREAVMAAAAAIFTSVASGSSVQ